jgi:hypothetical protein
LGIGAGEAGVKRQRVYRFPELAHILMETGVFGTTMKRYSVLIYYIRTTCYNDILRLTKLVVITRTDCTS